MKKANLKLTIPENLSEITLEQYQKWAAIANKDNEGTYFLKQKTVEIFCKVPLNIVANISHRQVDDLFNSITDMFNEEDYGDFERVFVFRGVEFGMEPNFNKMSSGVFADLGSNLSDVKDWHRAMAALYRPVTIKKKHKILNIEQYLIEQYNGSEELGNYMKLLPMNKVLGAVFFLIHSLKILQRDMMSYLDQQIKKMDPEELKKILSKNGDGITAFTGFESLMDMEGMKLPTFQSMNFSQS